MEAKKINYEINKLFWDEQSQDVTLQVDTPIIAKVNNKDMGFVNNERFNIFNIENKLLLFKMKRKN